MVRKVLLAAVAALVLVVAFGVHVWREATALPDWYTEADLTLDEHAADDVPPAGWTIVPDRDEPVSTTPLEASMPALSGSPSSKPTRSARARKSRRSARHELRGFHRRAEKGSERSPVKASRAVYEDGRLEAGVIFDLSRIPRDELVRRDRELYDRAVGAFPGITKRDVYIGIEDRPVSAEAVLQLGPDPEVRIGNLRYPLDTAARKIGMAPAELRRELDRELRRLGFVDPTTSR